MIPTRTPPAEPLRLVLRTQPSSVSPHDSVVVIRCARLPAQAVIFVCLLCLFVANCFFWVNGSFRGRKTSLARGIEDAESNPAEPQPNFSNAPDTL